MWTIHSNGTATCYLPVNADQAAAIDFVCRLSELSPGGILDGIIQIRDERQDTDFDDSLSDVVQSLGADAGEANGPLVLYAQIDVKVETSRALIALARYCRVNEYTLMRGMLLAASVAGMVSPDATLS